MTTFLESLDLTESSAGTFQCRSVQLEGRPVFGGQLLAQAIMAAAQLEPDRSVRSLSVVFPRTGDPRRPIDVTTAALHRGRTLSSLRATFTQGDRVVCEATIVTDTDGEADVMRYADAMAHVSGPHDATPAPLLSEQGAEVRVVGGADIFSSHADGPAELLTWVRWPHLTAVDRATHSAVALWYTDALLIAASMRPVEGLDISMAHEFVSTGVLTHTVSFHAPIDASQWHLVENRVAFAGGGRIYGTGSIYTESGDRVMSFAQDSMVRQIKQTSGAGPVM